MNLGSKVKVKEQPCLGNTRELDGVPSNRIYILYTLGW